MLSITSRSGCVHNVPRPQSTTATAPRQHISHLTERVHPPKFFSPPKKMYVPAHEHAMAPTPGHRPVVGSVIRLHRFDSNPEFTSVKILDVGNNVSFQVQLTDCYNNITIIHSAHFGLLGIVYSTLSTSSALVNQNAPGLVKKEEKTRCNRHRILTKGLARKQAWSTWIKMNSSLKITLRAYVHPWGNRKHSTGGARCQRICQTKIRE